MVDGLSERFQENVECSTHVDIAVAWATKTPVLDRLVKAVKENGVSLRIIVGTHGNATDPDILDRLNKIGELRIVPHRGPLFHPKVYIFHGEEDSIALIGSANFTNGGFGENIEAVFETKPSRSVRKWFNSQWKKCGKFPENKSKRSRSEAIERYRRRRRLKPPSRILAEIIGKPMRDPGNRLGYFDQVQDWRGYVKALDQCQKWWEGRPEGWTVYDDTRSWTHTIEQVGLIATTDDWNDLTEDEIRQLLGRYNDGVLDSGLLGTMRPKAVNVFREDMELRQRLNDAVQTVVNAHPTDFPRVAVTAVDHITGEGDIGVGVATRILALARPDRVISLNGASGDGLEQIFPGIDKLNPAKYSYGTVLGHYGRFLGRLYEEPWFDSKKPRGAREQRLWSMRAALLDCFVYRAP
jgi:HKD family nuclease